MARTRRACVHDVRTSCARHDRARGARCDVACGGRGAARCDTHEGGWLRARGGQDVLLVTRVMRAIMTGV